MSEKIEAKENLKPKELKNISSKQVEYHFDTHYKGYVTKINEIWGKLENADRSKANQNYSDFRELKVEESFNLMGVVLHEYYFENLSSTENKISENMKKAIINDFGSFEKWLEDFKAVGTAFRGWSILAFDLNIGKLRNYGADAHNMYGIWNAIPVLVLDVYEHAYYTDFGPKRAPYMDAFINNINWSVVEKRYTKSLNAYAALK
ncbi:MAG: superoxide dismutase [Candidatus Thermoplasmatota archaeon]|nr:superoxide dismutase [Candidatus Thermoplasmatota archaeon]MCL5962917.1 superoxide dismutase [Candidatus Thermoplasmatota archaeon]